MFYINEVLLPELPEWNREKIKQCISRASRFDVHKTVNSSIKNKSENISIEIYKCIKVPSSFKKNLINEDMIVSLVTAWLKLQVEKL